MLNKLLKKSKAKPSLRGSIEKIVSLFGENGDEGINKDTPNVEELGAIFDRHPLSSFLHYEHFDQETGLFHNKKSVGFILEASLLTGATQETENILTSIVADVLPNDADIQF